MAKARANWPETPIFPSLTAMIKAGVCEAVTITTPPETRRDLVLEAIGAGLHVIVDKPFAPNYKGAMELSTAAKAKGVTLGVYQNRRYDADLQTLAKVIADGRLGKLWRVHNRMDFDDPATLEVGPTGGLLRDPGSHVVDQMLWLNGPATSVWAHLDHVDLPQGRTDASFVITLSQENGRMSEVSASKLNCYTLRELRAYGDKGAFVSHGTDIQAQEILAGKRPADDPVAWGYEPEANWGTLHTASGTARVPSEQGRYHDYYATFAQAVRDGTPPPVTAETGARTLAILDAARQGADEGRSIAL